MDKVNKKLGLGSLSLLLGIMGLLFSYSFGSKGCYGDILLNYIGIKPWSDGSSGGIHFTIFYSSIFFIPSLILGYKFKNNLGAALGKRISFIVILILIILGIPALMT